MQRADMSATVSSSASPLTHSVGAAARLIGIGESTCWQLISRGRIHAIRVGGRTLVPAGEVERVLRDGC